LVQRGRDGAFSIQPGGVARTHQAVIGTVRAVRQLGKKAVVVAPPPTNNYDTSRCHERREMGLAVLGVPNDCSIDRALFIQKTALVHELLAELPRDHIEVVRFEDYLCDAKRCRSEINGTPIYRDKGHLSYEGSALLSRAVSLTHRIARAAR
jgi:hypothetical protein